MQAGNCGTFLYEDFTTCTGSGAEDQQRSGLIPGLSALIFLFLGGVEIFVLLFGHSAADVSFHLPTVVIAGISFGLCILTVKLKPAL